ILLQMTGNSEIDVAGLKIGGTNSTNIASLGAAPLYINQGTSNGVIIGGDVTVNSGTIYATYQDVAEWVPASESMTAGTVVVLSAETTNTVMPSTHSYDTSVAGVVSPSPGLLLGTAGASKAKIAT